MSTEEATISEITDKTEDDANTTKNEVAKTATIETSNGDKTSSDGDKNLDVKDNPYILTPPPIESPPPQKKLPKYRPLSSDISLEKWEDTTYVLTRDLMRIQTSECSTQLLRNTYVLLKTRRKQSTDQPEPEW